MMLKNIVLISILLTFYYNSSAQKSEYQLIYDRYTAIDLDFFNEDQSDIGDNPLYKAFKANIEGDQEKHLYFLEKSTKQIDDKELLKSVQAMLYYTYFDHKMREKADSLDRSSEDLNFNLYANIVAKKSDYPDVTLQTSTHQTEVEFDQFYFDAVVAENDTVRVFFDTGAPGITVNQELVQKYNWKSDTAYYGYSTLPAMGITYKDYPVLLPNLKIGSFEFKNLPARYSVKTEEQKERLKSAGIEDHDILIGLDVFEKLCDGVEFDFKNNLLRLVKELPVRNLKPNFVMVDSKPATAFKLSGKHLTAFLDTGSPRHVLPDKLITENNSYFKEKGNYGDFTYDIFYVKYDQVLNQEDIWLDTADYGGFSVSETFEIDALFGSFLGRTLAFDLRNRIATIEKTP